MGILLNKLPNFVFFIISLREPNATKLENEKYGCILSSLGQISGVVPYTTFYATSEYINKNKNTIQKFNNAINKGLKFVKENNAKTIAKAIIKEFPDTKLEELTTFVQRYKDADSWYNTTLINIKDYRRLVDIMIYGKSLNNRIDVNNLVTNEFN